jgi:hypothetical protein
MICRSCVSTRCRFDESSAIAFAELQTELLLTLHTLFFEGVLGGVQNNIESALTAGGF